MHYKKNSYQNISLLTDFPCSLGIKSIINLQCPKEHASCGQPLESSGFSYDPTVFMEQNSKFVLLLDNALLEICERQK